MRVASPCLLVFAQVLLVAHASQMVSIPAGEFTMGRTKTTNDDKTGMRPRVLLDDRPARTVKLRAFQINAKEITNAEYAAFVQKTKHRAPYHWINGQHTPATAEFPVYNVSWEDAKAFCEWGGKRLPTEAEWERAARGGVEGKDYPNGDTLTIKDARYAATDGPTATGKFPPNALGLYDMAGNVAEWTADWFAGDYYTLGENDNPQGPKEGLYKVIRGGAWSDTPKRVTVFFRNWVRPTQRTPNIGFRCAQ